MDPSRFHLPRYGENRVCREANGFFRNWWFLATPRCFPLLFAEENGGFEPFQPLSTDYLKSSSQDKAYLQFSGRHPFEVVLSFQSRLALFERVLMMLSPKVTQPPQYLFVKRGS